MSNVTRRDFLWSSMAAGAGLAMLKPTSRVLGANDEITDRYDRRRLAGQRPYPGLQQDSRRPLRSGV